MVSFGSNRENFVMTQAGDIEKAHAQLVEQRRLIIEALAKGYQRRPKLSSTFCRNFRTRSTSWTGWGALPQTKAIDRAREKLATAYERHPDDTSPD
jgi:hypothetical protein